MKKSLPALSMTATIAFTVIAVAGSEANGFEGVEVSIPVLSHDYYLGKNSGASHYWHGENRDTRFIKTGGTYAVTSDPTGVLGWRSS
jgi:hypothetical protein